MLKTDICILGAGASGLMCACNIENKNVIIIDKDDKIGKKILATGNGRCNLSNINLDIEKYNTPLVEKYFKKFSQYDTINYFSSLGLETFFDDEGRVYPLSNTATSVLDVLRLKIEQKNNIKILCNNTIKKITNFGDYFIVYTQNEEIKANKVVLSMGGNAKIDFDNIHLQKLTFTKSLGAIKTDKNKGLNNIKVSNVLVTCDDVNFSQKGEVLFKDDSISGIVIFNLSSKLAQRKNFNTQIKINFLPDMKKEDILSMLLKRKDNLKNYPCENFLTGLFHKSLNINLMIEKCKINKKFVKDLSIQDLKNLTDFMTNYTIKTYNIMDNNQVFSGGINLKMLDINLMFKSINNLYAIGEIVDVDGECGGFNLQWAWTSGYICGKNL